MATDQINAEKMIQVLQEKGLEFILGMNVDRHWVTGAQTFVNPDQTMIVFREQNIVTSEAGEPDIAVKNVTSVVMPTAVAHAILEQLTEAFKLTGGVQIADVQPAK